MSDDDFVQVSTDRSTVWVHAKDGSTVGRFSKRFGMDVHTTIAEQLAGKGQCLHCTHTPATLADWHTFCDLIATHYDISIDRSALDWPCQRLVRTRHAVRGRSAASLKDPALNR